MLMRDWISTKKKNFKHFQVCDLDHVRVSQITTIYVATHIFVGPSNILTFQPFPSQQPPGNMLPSLPAQLLKAPVPPAAICRSNWLPCTSQPFSWKTSMKLVSCSSCIPPNLRYHIPPMRSRKLTFSTAFGWDMLVPGRVVVYDRSCFGETWLVSYVTKVWSCPLVAPIVRFLPESKATTYYVVCVNRVSKETKRTKKQSQGSLKFWINNDYPPQN